MTGVSGIEPAAAARSDGTTVTFRVADPASRLAGVRLSQDVRIPGDLLDFRPVQPPARRPWRRLDAHD